jgi:hypothetical protein
MEHAVKQHGAMATGQNKSITIRPIGAGRTMIQMIQKQDGRNIGHTHGHTGMPRICFLHTIHRKTANCISHYINNFTHRTTSFQFYSKICKKPLAENLHLPYIATVNGSDSRSVVQSAIPQASGEHLSRY